jgi:hypothetical protein
MDKKTKSESKAKGGKARAEQLSPDQRKEIARKAAVARWEQEPIPKANYSGILRIAGSEIPCAVVVQGDNIKRVIVQREMVGLLTGNKKGDLDRYLKAGNMKPFIPIKFKDKSLDQATILLEINGRRAYCYEGEDIVDLCKMYLDARKAGNILLPNQMQLADRAEIIITSLAKTGIIGLIDEATGYQQVRAKDALEAYLNKIIRKELAAWVKRFPDEFFEQMYRLKGWNWKGNSQHPSYVGKIVKDIVYARRGPGILEELEKRNPVISEKKRRLAKHTQWLTEDVGHPALAQHLYAVIGLMRMCDDWGIFMAFLNRAYPRSDDKQLRMFLP